MRTRRLIAPGVLAAVMLAACGPVAPVDTDVAHDGVNVFFGVPTPAPPPSLPPIIIHLNPIPGFPAPVEPPPVVLPTPPTPPPNPCPTLSPLTFPATPAGPVSDFPPAEVTYAFRYVGTVTNTVTNQVSALPATGTRQVANVSAVGTNGDYTFDVIENYDGQMETTSYHVYPQSLAGTLPAENPGAGVYITKIVTVDPTDASRDGTFAPNSPGVEIFAMPAAPAVTWKSAATDPVDGGGQTEVIGPTTGNPKGTASIVGDARVDACGQAIDTWEATMNGEVDNAVGGPNATTDFTLTIDMATENGGLIVADTLVTTYLDPTTNVKMTSSVTSTINTVPVGPS